MTEIKFIARGRQALEKREIELFLSKRLGAIVSVDTPNPIYYKVVRCEELGLLSNALVYKERENGPLKAMLFPHSTKPWLDEKSKEDRETADILIEITDITISET